MSLLSKAKGWLEQPTYGSALNESIKESVEPLAQFVVDVHTTVLPWRTRLYILWVGKFPEGGINGND